MPLDGHLDVAAGDAAVEFALAVRNAGASPVDLAFPHGNEADVVVYEEGVAVWRWSDDRALAQASGTERLAPDERVVYERRWEDPPPGRYVAEASLAARDVTLVERAPFEV